MTHFSQQDNFSVAARVLGALFYYAPESAEAAPLVAVLTSDGWETQWPLPEASLAPLVTASGTRASVWGINGRYLGPTIRVWKGDDVKLIYSNRLTENVSMTVAGLQVPGPLMAKEN